MPVPGEFKCRQIGRSRQRLWTFLLSPDEEQRLMAGEDIAACVLIWVS